MTSMYETDLLLNQYLLFHYGTAEDQLPYAFGPRDSLFFPLRCVTEFLPEIGKVERSLDLGCAVGRSTFELSRWSDEALGIDSSHRFIQCAQSIQKTGRIEIRRTEEGAIVTLLQRELPSDIRRESCRFEVGDATSLGSEIGSFDVVLAANLIDRVGQPRKLLRSLAETVRSGGHLILTSPYTWLEEFTPAAEWMGGTRDNLGHATLSLEGLTTALNSTFSHEQTKDMPFLIREHARKFQWSVAQATLWKRK
ncbi:MAG TPA: putative 4-mercaptohistidine N1-methyltransferase [Chthoniobacterales bacterium]|nr:putative 4-mercaptohistidine N1-methyltransferase [Chthoniobacterales bacterium]